MPAWTPNRMTMTPNHLRRNSSSRHGQHALHALPHLMEPRPLTIDDIQ